MEHWRPVPQALIADLMLEKWTETRPAPEIVGWLIAFDRTMARHPISVRRLADYCGWSRWKANQVSAKVKAFCDTWQEYQPVLTNSQRPSKANNDSNLQSKTGQEPDGSQTENRHRARGIKETKHEHVQLEDKDVQNEASKQQETKSGSVGVPVADVWSQMEEIRKRQKPGTKSRQLRGRYNDLKNRIIEHGAEEVLHAWRWLWESEDRRAVFMRSNGYETGSFLRASNLREYVDKANDWNPDVRSLGDWFSDADFDEHGNIIQLKQNGG